MKSFSSTFSKALSQMLFTCTKSTMETPKKFVKTFSKLTKKSSERRWRSSCVFCFHCWNWISKYWLGYIRKYDQEIHVPPKYSAVWIKSTICWTILHDLTLKLHFTTRIQFLNKILHFLQHKNMWHSMNKTIICRFHYVYIYSTTQMTVH